MDRIIKYVATKNIKPTDELFINLQMVRIN